MKILKPFTYLLAIILSVAPLLLGGCGIFDSYKKNKEGFYENHYSSCGSIALEKALYNFFQHNGLPFGEQHTREELSKVIQKRGTKLKELLAYFDKDAICITWPSEIKHVVEKYGLELITMEDIERLDAEKDTAIVLVHGKLLSSQYHWLVFPDDNIIDYYGDKTVIDKIYLLKLKK